MKHTSGLRLILLLSVLAIAAMVGGLPVITAGLLIGVVGLSAVLGFRPAAPAPEPTIEAPPLPLPIEALSQLNHDIANHVMVLSFIISDDQREPEDERNVLEACEELGSISVAMRNILRASTAPCCTPAEIIAKAIHLSQPQRSPLTAGDLTQHRLAISERALLWSLLSAGNKGGHVTTDDQPGGTVQITLTRDGQTHWSCDIAQCAGSDFQS